MTKIDNFLVLSKMCDRNDKSIKLYSGETNFIGSTTGKDGWGKVIVAVDNETILDDIANNRATISLLIYDSDVFKKIKKEMENETL